MTETPHGYCRCGCGQRTGIAKSTRRKLGHVAGEPLPFLRAHNRRRSSCPESDSGRWVDSNGYVRIWAPDHPRAIRGYAYEHIIVVERAMGKHLPEGAEIHHINGVKSDNRPCNLIPCQDHSHHMLIEVRQAACEACGHADWRRCRFCREWGPPGSMYTRPPNRESYHRECRNSHLRGKRAKRAPRAARVLRGSENPFSRLDEARVSEIRNRYQKGGVTQAELATLYGVSASTVHNVVNGHFWKHVP